LAVSRGAADEKVDDGYEDDCADVAAARE